MTKDIEKKLETSSPTHAPGGYSEVWLLAYPVIVTMASRTFMGLVDTALVGKLGATELAAVGLAGILSWTLLSFFNGLIGSINIFVAQRYGSQDRRRVAVAVWQGFYISLASYIVVLLISRFAVVHIFALMNPSAEVQQLGVIYAQIRLYGGIAIFTLFNVSGFLRGIGDTKTPMWIEIGANLLNILLDYLLIFGHFGFPRLEVAGAAIATVISGVFATIAYLAVFFSRKHNGEFETRSTGRLELGEIRRVLRIGIPMGIQYVLDMGSFTVFSAMIGRMGDVALAANTAAITLLSTSYMPLYGISMASTTLVGQYIGSAQLHYARKSGYTAMKIGGAYTFFVAILFMTMPQVLLSVITADLEVIRLGRGIMMVAALFQLSNGLGISSSGALRGAGDTFFTMMVGIACAWLLFLPLAYGFGVALGYGVVGAWVGATIYIILMGIIYFLRFRSGKWEQIRI